MKVREKPGWVVRRAPDGHIVVTLHYSADPEKNSVEWAEARRRDMPDEPSFLREYEISWTSSEGAPVFPEFAGDPRRYVDPELRLNPELPVFRGWDFGHRSPAMVVMQVQGLQVCVLRELTPQDIDTHSFRDLVMLLCGQSFVPGSSEATEEHFAAVREAMGAKPRMAAWFNYLRGARPWWGGLNPRRSYEVPWWPVGLVPEWHDFSGPEAYQKQAFESEKGERSDAEVLAARGIIIEWNATPVSYGENIIRRLLLDVEEGKPGLRIHPACVNLIAALAGGLVYRRATRHDPRPDRIARVPPYIDVYDAFRYAIVNIADVAEHVRAAKRRLPDPRTEAALREQAWPVRDRPYRGIVCKEAVYDAEDQ